MRDFSFEMLDFFFRQAIEKGYSFYSMESYWDGHIASSNTKPILLRHDVDRFPSMSLELAKLENRLGLSGTYYFRMKPGVFVPKIVTEIKKLGHNIGYHYETLADAKGDHQLALELFEKNLTELRKLAPVRSVAMHSRPLSKWDNRDILDKQKLSDFGLIGEPYLSIPHQEFLYVADSGRNWGGDRNVVWDWVDSSAPVVPELTDTPALVDWLSQGEDKKIHMLIHPHRWTSSIPGWLSIWTLDKIWNTGKTLIKSSRQLSQKVSS